MNINPVAHFPQMIAPEKHSGGANIDVFSPYDEHLIATVASSNEMAVEQALCNAAALFASKQDWLTTVHRIAILERAISLMQEQAEALAALAAEEGGKPIIDSRIEMVRCIDSIRICVDTLRTKSATAPVMGTNTASNHRIAWVEQEPIGVVLAVSAFNHPLNLIAHQIAPAIAVGCPVIIKPAKDTPLSCIQLVKIFHAAGLPEAWCQWIIPATTALSEALVSDQRVAFFSFIGSAKVGWYLRSKLAAGTRCALEHGGVAPVIVAQDVDVDAAMQGFIKGAFYHAGQVCVSIQRMFVHASIARDLANKIAQQASALHVGNPLSEKTDVGPLIRASEVKRIQSWVDEAVASGGLLLCGGKRVDQHCFAPTVIFGPSASSKVSTMEIFGPVVCIYPFTDLDAAIAQANALEVAFQAAVYTQTIDTALYVSSRLAASTVMVNDHTAFRVDWMPFAGLKHSGLATGGIPYTMHDMQTEKMTVIYSTALKG
ncbi:MAG: aldehyde dehydrogenase family protein [Mariprofundaceae bacterium]|nr:aldehyde dehydrogenase family protein [Mariprofundaceae bacterium]